MSSVRRSQSFRGRLMVAAVLLLSASPWASAAVMFGTPEADEALKFDPFNPQAYLSATGDTGSPILVPGAASIVMSAPAPAATPTDPTKIFVSVSDAPRVLESTTAKSEFKIRLSKASNKTVKVNYITKAGTATHVRDYVSTSGTLTFSPGQVEKKVYVPIKDPAGDPPGTDPFLEYYYLVIGSPVNASISRGQGKAEIQDTPSAPPPAPLTIKVSDTTVNEDPPTQYAKFTVTLSRKSSSTVTVKYNTSNGTAKSGYDYQSTSGTVTFSPNQTVKTVQVKILDPHNDPTGDKPTEDFFLNLTNPSGGGATISDNKGRAVIKDG